MKRSLPFRFRGQCGPGTRVVLLLAALLSGAVGQAQPTINPVRVWQYDHRPDSRMYRFNDIAQVERNRFVQVGYFSPTGTGGIGDAYVLFTNAQGDTLYSRRYPQLLPYQIREFLTVTADPDSGFLATSQLHTGGFGLISCDRDGNVRWHREYQPPPNNGVNSIEIRALPDGYLLLFSFFDNLATYGQLWKVDRRGRLQWQQAMPPSNWPWRARPLACRDGSFVIATQSIYNSTPPWTGWSYDHWLARYRPDGTQIHSGFAGRRNSRDQANALIETPDGGVVLVGTTKPFQSPAQNAKTLGQFIKLDSLLQPQWRVELPATWNANGSLCWFTSVQPLTNGHYWAAGINSLPGGIPPDPAHLEGLIAEIAPPSQPGDSVGQVVAQWNSPAGWYLRGLPQANDTAYFWGTSERNYQSGKSTYLTQFVGLGTPAPVDVCATPPVLPSLAVTWAADPGNPRQFAFTADSLQAHPGPRYAEISRVRWDFGDGSIGYGWQPQHTYATTQPVRARVCVYNNLYCATCHEFFPLGPLSVQQELEASVSVFPNPSPDGRFTLQVSNGQPAPATLTVLDGVGRTVLTQPVNSPETVVDLRASATGVYALRLTWPDGRTLTRRLVR